MEARILEVELEGFGSFRKKALIVFPKGDNVILIDGKWINAATRSGSGKSTICKAIAFALGIEESSQATLKNWDSKKMSVRVRLQIGESVVDVTRDPKLSLIIDNVPYNGLTTGATETLHSMLGGNAEIIKSITYRKQRKPGKIIHSTDSQIKQFLTEPLNLTPVEKAAEQLQISYNATANNLALLQRDADTLKSTLPMNLVTEEESTRARTAYDEAKAQYDSLLANQANPAAMQELQAKVAQLQSEIATINQVINNVNLANNNNNVIRGQIVGLQAEIAHLEKSSCPTCQRDWDKAQELLKAKNAQIDQLAFNMRSNLEYIANSGSITANLPNLQQLLADAQRKIGESSAPLNMAIQSLNSATSTLNLLQSKYTNYQTMSGRLQDTQAKIAASERELTILETASKLLGRSGFLGCIFDEILADIEARTNDMLQHFPNAEQFTVQISSNKLVKTKGTTKKEISVTISRGGIDVEYDGISGGQQSAIELCTDLAYAEAVRARSGCALRWTCLDEVMDGLGPSEKEQVVDMIRKRIKGLVLMIEHATEIKQSFDQVINIEYDCRESHVTAN